jgi:hypothetical protein
MKAQSAAALAIETPTRKPGFTYGALQSARPARFVRERRP